MHRTIIVLFTCLLTLRSATVLSQVKNTETPTITVNGIAEKEVVPDEIYISITLSERYNGPNATTIEIQEEQLKDTIKKLGVDLANLSLSNVNASYVRVNWDNTDVVAKKSFSLKLKDAEMVGRIFHALFEMNIKESYISKVDFSKKEYIKKELRAEAMQDAKAKATAMLAAIGEVIGKPESISINEQNQRDNNYNGMAALSANSRAGNNGDNEFVEFKKMKFSATVTAKFEIKQ